MRASFVRIMLPAVLAVYILLTVGVGVHVCRCCGTVDVTFAWKLALIWDWSSGCSDGEEPCCDMQVYAIEDSFCHRTDDSLLSPLMFMDGLFLAYIPASGYVADPGSGICPDISACLREASPPENILTTISQFRL